VPFLTENRASSLAGTGEAPAPARRRCSTLDNL